MDHIYAVGVGGANIDLCGRSYAPIEPRDSNPGEIEISAGGVTRNICDNLARLGADVKLVSAVGDDLFAQIICEQSAQAGPISITRRGARPQCIWRFWITAAICTWPFRICTCCKIFRWTILSASGS